VTTEPLLTDEEVVERRNDGEMMRRPHLWPWRSFLPLTRPSGSDKELGLLTREDGTTVFLTDMVRRDLTAGRINYESVEAILADGWKVD